MIKAFNLIKQEKGAIKRNLFFIFATSVLLSGCGGSQNSSPPPRKMAALKMEMHSVATTGTASNQRQTDLGDEDPPATRGLIHAVPAGTQYIVEAPFISQVPLRIVVGSSAYAELCLYNDDPQKQQCVTITSPLPAGMAVEYTDAALLDFSDDVRFLTFVPVISNSDPQGLAASRFIEALGDAATVWGKYLEQHPQLVTISKNAVLAGGASNLLLTGTTTGLTHGVKPGRTAYSSRNDCYAELAAAGLCNPDPDDADIPKVNVPGQLPSPEEPPPYEPAPPSFDPPPIELPPGGGGSAPPIGQYPKDGLLAQAIPVVPPCGIVGGGVVCSVTIFGKKPPALPPKEIDPVDRGHQYFAPQILCDWHILCNEGQEPRDNDRGPGAETSGKTQTELDQICVDINIREINVCKAIIKAKGRSIQEYMRELAVCEGEANKRMYACFDTAKRLTDNGAHPAP